MDSRYNAPFLATNPAAGLENLLGELVRGDLVETVKTGSRPTSITNAPENGLQTLGSGVRLVYTQSGRCQGWKRTRSNGSSPRSSQPHGPLAVSAATNRLRLGDKIRLIPGHCDPTVNLYD
jgi:D-serine deaminase-like pyridoxal phosphate-dependent protein